MSVRPLVLSIQSHVVHGRSGNSSAVLPLEASGIIVDPVNTCQYAAHSGYGPHRGSSLTIDEFHELIDALKSYQVLPTYTHLLTGFIPTPEMAQEIANVRTSLKDQVEYFCDPVLGDRGEFYVPEEELALFKRELIPIAQLITPNAYESVWLTGIEMRNPGELRQNVAALHEMGPKHVVITSTEWKHRISFFSWNRGERQMAIETPTLPRDFDGAGDLFTALLLANYINFPGQYELIATRTVNAVFSILERTQEMGSVELELPGSIMDIREPQLKFRIMPCEKFLQLDMEEAAILQKTGENRRWVLSWQYWPRAMFFGLFVFLSAFLFARSSLTS
jgi:pyridoxine kinase